MAISIDLPTKQPTLDLAKAAGCPAWGVQLDSLGVVVEASPKQLILKLGGSPVASVTLMVNALKLLLNNGLNSASKQMLSEKLCDLYESAVDHLMNQGKITNKVNKNADLIVPQVTPDTTSDPNVTLHQPKVKPAGDDVTPAPVTSSKASKPVGGAWSKASPVKLHGVTKVGVPVSATSQGSIYHSVAVSPGVNLAARLKCKGDDSWSLSLRFEGCNLSAHAKTLKELDVTMSDGYSSLHLNGQGGVHMAFRALGAVLLASGVEWQSTITSPLGLVNAGA